MSRVSVVDLAAHEARTDHGRDHREDEDPTDDSERDADRDLVLRREHHLHADEDEDQRKPVAQVVEELQQTADCAELKAQTQIYLEQLKLGNADPIDTGGDINNALATAIEGIRATMARRRGSRRA